MWIKDKQARLEDVGKRLDEAKEATEKNLGMGKEAMEEKVEEMKKTAKEELEEIKEKVAEKVEEIKEKAAKKDGSAAKKDDTDWDFAYWYQKYKCSCLKWNTLFSFLHLLQTSAFHLHLKLYNVFRLWLRWSSILDNPDLLWDSWGKD